MSDTPRFDYDDARFAAEHLQEQVKDLGYDEDSIKTGITLGSGLGNFAPQYVEGPDATRAPLTISFRDMFLHLNGKRPNSPAIPLPGEAVGGHAHALILGSLKGGSADRLLLAQSGRQHSYEGTPLAQTVFWQRVMQVLGVDLWVGSNAAGILTPKTLQSPSLMAVMESLTNTDTNPLIGPHERRFGERFPHLGNMYTAENINLAQTIASEYGFELPSGVYFRESGPHYESRAQVYDLRARVRGLWAEAQAEGAEDRFYGEPRAKVGMSTHEEVLVTQDARLSVQSPAFKKGILVISVGTNYAAGLGPNGSEGNPNHEEVKDAARTVQERFGELVHTFLLRKEANSSD